MTQEEPSVAMTTEEPAAGVDISEAQDGGVVKVVKRAGSSDGGRPLVGDRVSVHYTGTLLDGTKFDSSRDRGEYFEFTLGKGEVIKAWDQGVATMTRGELCVLTCKPDYAYGERGSPPTIPPNSTLVFEVELFSWKGEDLTETKDGGIVRSMIEKGPGYQSPTDGSTCTVQVVGSHAGRQFDDRELTFTLGEGEVHNIPAGVETALTKFKQGERSKLLLSSQYGFGSTGCEAFSVPADAALEYTVTLKTFDKCKESWEMEPTEKLEQAGVAKQKGTDFFKGSKFRLALRYYGKVVDYLKEEGSYDGEQATTAQTLLLAARLNSAMCHLKLSQHLSAIGECEEALELDEASEKAYFRRATALMNIQNYTEAIDDFQMVLKLDPNNKAAKNQITMAQVKIKAQKDKEKKLYAGMFQRFADQDSKREAAAKKDEPAAENLDEISAQTESAPETNGVTTESTEPGNMETASS